MSIRWPNVCAATTAAARRAELCGKLERTAFADKPRRLAEGGWYLLPDGAAADLPWAAHADLPLVEVRVDGVEGHFLLDTGVGETLIDPALAREGKIVPFSEEREAAA